MKKITFAALFACAVCFGFGCDSGTNQQDSVDMAEDANEARIDSMDTSAMNDTTDLDDQAEFMVKAASGGMMEVALGNMAANQATNPEVKSFAKMMVTDHTKANEELKTLAASKNVTLPTRMGEDHQKHVDKMADLRGADFDREYMSMMVEDHEEDVEDFREASQENEYDAEVKAFAGKTLTTLEKHLQQAKQIRDKLSGSTTSSSTTTDRTTTTTPTSETPKR